MRTRWRYALAALLVVVVLAAFDQSQEVRWVGGYPVQVRIERSSRRPVSSASVAVLFRREWELTEGDPARIDSGWQSAPSSGEPFTVLVRCGGKDSGLGRTISYAQQEVLVLRLAYLDGGGELVAAELPDSRIARELVVRAP